MRDQNHKFLKVKKGKMHFTLEKKGDATYLD